MITKNVIQIMNAQKVLIVMMANVVAMEIKDGLISFKSAYHVQMGGLFLRIFVI